MPVDLRPPKKPKKYHLCLTGSELVVIAFIILFIIAIIVAYTSKSFYYYNL